MPTLVRLPFAAVVLVLSRLPLSTAVSWPPSVMMVSFAMERKRASTMNVLLEPRLRVMMETCALPTLAMQDPTNAPTCLLKVPGVCFVCHLVTSARSTLTVAATSARVRMEASNASSFCSQCWQRIRI
jgi:hypothetical protein